MRPSGRTYEFCGATIASSRVLPELRRSAPGARAECAIAFGESSPLASPGRWFHEWRLPGGRLLLSIGRVPSGYLLRFRDQADFLVSANGRRITVHPAGDVPEETIRHLLIDQVLPLALSRRGRLSLHASAVHLPGVGTVGFVGGTGRGKSTLAVALAARGGRIVTDDCLTVDLRGGARALPGYPGLRLWPGLAANPLLLAAPSTRVAHYSAKRRVHRRLLPFRGVPSPLRALFLLSPRSAGGPAASFRVCRASARMMGLLRFAYVLDVEDRRDLSGLFASLATLVTTVPVLRLRLRHGHTRLPNAAALIHEYVSGARP